MSPSTCERTSSAGKPGHPESSWRVACAAPGTGSVAAGFSPKTAQGRDHPNTLKEKTMKLEFSVTDTPFGNGETRTSSCLREPRRLTSRQTRSVQGWSAGRRAGTLGEAE